MCVGVCVCVTPQIIASFCCKLSPLDSDFFLAGFKEEKSIKKYERFFLFDFFFFYPFSVVSIKKNFSRDIKKKCCTRRSQKIFHEFSEFLVFL